MDKDKAVVDPKQDLFVKYSEEITPAFKKAVREALLRHKRAGVPIAVSIDGKVVIVQPDEI